MTPSPLQGKAAFFRQLDELSRIDDDGDGGDDDDDGRELEQRRRAGSRAFFHGRSAAKREPDKTQSRSNPARSSAVVPNPTRRNCEGALVEGTPATGPRGPRAQVQDRQAAGPSTTSKPPPAPARAPPGLLKSAAIPSPAPPSPGPSATASATGKRKRSSMSEKIVPEADRIFTGLSFFYIPNDDVAPARKMRITKARDYGARWTRGIEDATHVIVDKNLQYDDIKSLVTPMAESGSVVLVNELYPLDCIGFRNLLNPDQAQYRVIGCPALRRASETDSHSTSHAAPSQSSDRSLPPKPRQTNPGKWDYVPPQSPPRSGESSRGGGLEGGPKGGHTEPDSGQGVWLATSDLVVPASQDAASHGPGEARSPPAADSHQASTASKGIRDELSEYIELMQQYKDLPLDDEDEDLQSPDPDDVDVDSSGQESEGERDRKRHRPVAGRGPGSKDIAFEDRFACHQGGTKDNNALSASPNARTIEVLQSMCDYYSRINDHWRTTAYRKAISTLKRQPTRITTREEARRLANIGERLAMKIEEIVTTNRLKRLEYAESEPVDEVLQKFLGIYDVGTHRANKWIAQGYRTLEDLVEKANLTPNQRVWIDHLDDLSSRIPRREVEALGDHVRRQAARIDAKVELLIGGSYRRGADSSGDVDIVVTKKGTTSAGDLVCFLEELVAALTQQGFLVATLAALHSSRPGKEGPGSQWHGCCVLPRIPGGFNDSDSYRPVWRRVDLLLVPETEYGAALLYFTGNDIFNRSMRLLASKKDMRLNQRGLYRGVMRGRGRVKVTEGELVEGRDERRIFEILGVQWREPWERWC